MRSPHHDGWFGLGFSVAGSKEAPDILESVGNYGWGGAAATTFWVDPQEELVGLLMTQIGQNPYPFHAQFKVLTYQALTE